MTLPAGITPITITGKVANNKGVPATAGTVTFRMPYALADGPDHVVLAPGVWTFPIGSDGMIDTSSDPMPAATSAGVSPTGWSYDITVRATLADGTTWYRRFYATIPASTSFEQLIAAAAPAPAPALAYVPLAAVGVSVAPLVGNKVPTQFLPPGGGGGLASVNPLNGTIEVDDTDPLNPLIGVGSGIPQSSVSGLTTSLSAVAAAAIEAQATADAAQFTASAAYTKPVGGIPLADLAAAVQAMLAPQIPADLTQLGFHACNIPLYSARTVSTIGNETWYAPVLVRRGQSIGHVATWRSKSTSAALGGGGLNGFSVWSADGSTQLGSTVSDDNMWLPKGKIAKPISGIATPTVDTVYWVAAHVNGYSTPPEFMFQNLADSGDASDPFSRYKAGALSSWPASFNPSTDLVTGNGYILPLFVGA